MIGKIVTDGNRNTKSSDLKQGVLVVRRLEILALVKQRIRSDVFLLEHLTLALVKIDRGIEQGFLTLSPIRHRASNQHRDVGTLLRQAIQRALTVRDKIRKLKAVEGEIAADGQLGEDHQIGMFSFRLLCGGDHLLSVAFEIAYTIIELCNCYFHLCNIDIVLTKVIYFADIHQNSKMILIFAWKTYY